ncbi:MAG: hypothetical protein ACI9OJ_001144 [Myxococcota bacterium]|jgi:hypothetical protein
MQSASIRHALKGATAAVVLAAVALLLGLVTPPDDYRASGATLLDAVEQARAGDGSQWSGPTLPGQVLAVALSSSDAEGFGQLASVNAFLTAAATGAIAWLGFVFGGWLGCAAAFGAFLIWPSTLYHARNAGPEAVITLAWTLLLWAGTLRFKKTFGIIAATIAFAFAAATWHEAVWLIIPWVIATHFVADLPDPRGTGGTFAIGTVAIGKLQLAHLVVAIAGPLLAFSLWPHLADDFGKRLIAILYEPLKAQHAPILVAGEIHDQAISRAPGFADGLLVVVIRTPLTLGALAVVGALRAVRGIRIRDIVTRHLCFPLLGLAALLLIIGLNGSPFYAGIDGMAPLGPFVALLAAVGFAGVMAAAQSSEKRWLSWAVALALLVPATADRVLHFGSEPSYHSPIVGSARGAAALGFELRPTASLPVDLVAWMNDHLPTNAELAIYPSEDRYRPLLDRLTRDGLLRADIKTASAYHGTHLLVPEHPAYPLFDDRVRTAGHPIATIAVDGTLLLTLYKY